MPNVSNSSAPIGPYPPRDTYADDSGDAPCGPSSDVKGTLDSLLFEPLNLGHSNTEAGGHWLLDAGVSLATSKDMDVEAGHPHYRRIVYQARSGGTWFTWPRRDPDASDLPRRRTNSSSKWSNYQEESKAVESLDGLIDSESTTRDVSEHASSQLMRRTVNPTDLDDLQRNKPNTADNRDEMRRAHMTYTTRNKRASQPIPDDFPIRRRPVDISISAIEHTTESVDGRSKPVTRIGAWDVMKRALSIQTKRIKCLNQPVPSDLPVRRRSMRMPTTEMDCARQSTSQTTGSVDDASRSVTRARAWNDMEWAISGLKARIRRVKEPVTSDLPVRRQSMEMSITKLQCAHQGTSHTTESVDDGSGSVTRARAWNGMERAVSGPMARIRRANEPVPSDLPVRRRSMDMSITELQCARHGTSHITESVDDGSGSATRVGTWNGMERAISGQATRIRRANEPVPSDLPVRRRSMEMSITELECARHGASHITDSVDDGSGSATRVGAWNDMERAISCQATRIKRANEPVPSDLPVRRRSMDMFLTELLCTRQGTSLTTESVDDRSGSAPRAGAWNGMERAISGQATRIKRANEPVPSDLPVRRRYMDMSIAELECARHGLSHTTESVDDGSGSATRVGAWNGMERAISGQGTRIKRANEPVPSDLPVRRRSMDMFITELECARHCTSHTTESIDDGSGSAPRVGAWNGMERAISGQATRIKHTNEPVPSDLPVRRRCMEMSVTELECARQGTSHANESVDDGSGSATRVGSWNGMERKRLGQLTRFRRANEPVPSDLPIRRRSMKMPTAVIDFARLGTNHSTEDIDGECNSNNRVSAWNGMDRTLSVPTTRIRRANQPVPSDFPMKRRLLDTSITAVEHSRLGNITKAIDDGCGSRTRASAWNGMERPQSVSITSIRRANDTGPSDLPVRRPAIEMPLTEIRCARLDTSYTTECIDGGSRSNNRAGVWNGIKRALIVQTARIRRVNQTVLSDFPIRRRPLDMSIAALDRSRVGNSTKDVDGESGLDVIDNLEGDCTDRTSSTLSTSCKRESQSTPNDFPIRCLPLDMPVAATEGARRGTTHTTENIDDERRSTTIERLEGGRHTYRGATGRLRLNPVPTSSDLPRRKSADAYATKSGDINSARSVVMDRTQRRNALDAEQKTNTWSFKSREPVAIDLPRRSVCHAADITENEDALEAVKTNSRFWTRK